MTDFLWCAIGILSALSIWLRSTEEREKNRFYSRRDKLLKVVENNAAPGSIIEMPSYKYSRRIYNAETGKEEMPFTEYADDGRRRDIFVSIDGKDVRVFPWKKQNGKPAWED